MDKQQLDALDALRKRATPAPVQAVNLVHADRGGRMTPHEIGEYVANSVRVATGEAPSDFLALLCQKHDGPADVCHFGNGPTSAANAAYAEALWNAAPALLAIAREHEQLKAEARELRRQIRELPRLEVEGSRLREVRDRHACDMDEWAVKVECTQHQSAPPPLTVGELRALLAMAQENDRLRERLRATCQALVNAAGADGPMSAEDAADRLVAQHEQTQRDLAAAREEVANHNRCDARASLAQEIRETLKARGHWCPPGQGPDIISAVGMALDATPTPGAQR